MSLMIALLVGAEALSGSWLVDLRPTQDGKPVLQPMSLVIAADGKVSGTFYGTAIADGRANASNGRTCVAFTTYDNRGPYQHSGCLNGSILDGISWSTGRNFLLAWRAERGNAPAKP